MYLLCSYSVPGRKTPQLRVLISDLKLRTGSIRKDKLHIMFFDDDVKNTDQAVADGFPHSHQYVVRGCVGQRGRERERASEQTRAREGAGEGAGAGTRERERERGSGNARESVCV